MMQLIFVLAALISLITGNPEIGANRNLQSAQLLQPAQRMIYEREVERCEQNTCSISKSEILDYFEDHMLRDTEELAEDEREETYFPQAAVLCNQGRSRPCPSFCRRHRVTQNYILPRFCGTLRAPKKRQRCIVCRLYSCEVSYW